MCLKSFSHSRIKLHPTSLFDAIVAAKKDLDKRKVKVYTISAELSSAQ